MTADRNDVRRQGRREGERRKRRTLTALEARRERFVIRGRRVLLTRLLECGSDTVDYVREVVPLSSDIDPKLFGSVPGMLAFKHCKLQRFREERAAFLKSGIC